MTRNDYRESPRPDALVSDFRMPKGDGYRATEQALAPPEEWGGKMPAIGLTAHGRPEGLVRSPRAGFQTPADVSGRSPALNRDLVKTLCPVGSASPSKTLHAFTPLRPDVVVKVRLPVVERDLLA